MSSGPDLIASTHCLDNIPVYVAMVELEAESTFAFQGQRWLGDVAPEHLPGDLAARLADAKRRAAERQAIEARLPEHLLYTKGWPTCIPTPGEAELIAGVRRDMVGLMGFPAGYLTAGDVRDRYAELMAAKPESDSDDPPVLADMLPCGQLSLFPCAA
jgi:hypothetical protein